MHPSSHSAAPPRFSELPVGSFSLGGGMIVPHLAVIGSPAYMSEVGAVRIWLPRLFVCFGSRVLLVSLLLFFAVFVVVVVLFCALCFSFFTRFSGYYYHSHIFGWLRMIFFFGCA
jgi:hypothetical protein